MKAGNKLRVFLLVCSILVAASTTFFGVRAWKGYADERANYNRRKITPVNFSEGIYDLKEILRFPFLISPPVNEYSFLDGKILPEEGVKEFAIGVMIDNSTPARVFQIGLDDASLVVEALAEGGVTRFLAVFSSRQNVERIGPVRSAREYFSDFAKPFHGLFVHAGGSDTVMEEMKVQNNFFDVDHGDFGNATFWRDTSIIRPHNLFTGFPELRVALSSRQEKQGFRYLTNEIFSFSDVPIYGLPVHTIDLSFSYSDYASSWKWNGDLEVFVRAQQGSALDITAKNIVVMETEMWLILNDEKGRMGMNTAGSGEMLLFQDGKMIRGKWEKSDRNAPLGFTNSNGMPLTFLRGKTWIAVLDDLQKLAFE